MSAFPEDNYRVWYQERKGDFGCPHCGHVNKDVSFYFKGRRTRLPWLLLLANLDRKFDRVRTRETCGGCGQPYDIEAIPVGILKNNPTIEVKVHANSIGEVSPPGPINPESYYDI